MAKKASTQTRQNNKEQTNRYQATIKAPPIPANFGDRKFTKRILHAHWFALIFTAGHTLWYVWASTSGFKFFASLGLLGLEYLLYNIFMAIKEGELVGPQKTTALRFYYIILLFLTAGVLAQYIPVELVKTIYYGWLLPMTGGLVVLTSIRIMLGDPFNQLKEEKAWLAIRANHEVQREKFAQLKQTVDEIKEWRRLRSSTFLNRMKYIWKESMGWKTRGILKRNARHEYREALEQWGVTVTKGRSLFQRQELPSKDLLDLESQQGNGSEASTSPLAK